VERGGFDRTAEVKAQIGVDDMASRCQTDPA
jgi:hypothetical protein